MKSACIAGAAILVCTLASCDFDRSRPAMGQASSIIVVAPDSLWAAVGDRVLTALEPRIFTVRDEKAFEVTQVSPLQPEWRDLRRFRRILAIGTPGDGWIQPILERGRTPQQLPAMVETRQVWARGQSVTAIVIPSGGGAQDVYALLPAVADTVDVRYRAYARTRMFASGANTALRTSLARDAGFALLLPNIYRYEPVDSSYVFRHHSDMGGILLRTILVTWRPGIADDLDEERVLAWRDSVGSLEYEPGHNVDDVRIEARAVTARGRSGFEVQGVWQSRDTNWPAAGPFITRVLPCAEQNRTYLLDAWLYAPSKPKYEYMIQLQTILDTFRCGRDAIESAWQAASS